jgi:hypothetical protein
VRALDDGNHLGRERRTCPCVFNGDRAVVEELRAIAWWTSGTGSSQQLCLSDFSWRLGSFDVVSLNPCAQKKRQYSHRGSTRLVETL